ncbi:hypothetical protein B0H14DRAFT_1140066 [Mycena olivaceomarginata]|nr:hypothetical protein B0H14DRAFT_1140066 [Mycena olivaceomarginata]
MQRRPEAGELTPYPLPSQSQTYQPPPARRDKSVHFQTANPAPEAPRSPAPSYNTLSSTNFSSDSEAEGDSRRPPRPRALPPYPSHPPVSTGWAALSDVKVASAIAVPPRYPEDGHQQMHPYPSPPLSFDSRSRSESAASSSRLPPTPERPERGPQPPHYSPPSSPRLGPSHLRLPVGPGPISPQYQNQNWPTTHYSRDAAYPTPQTSSFSSPSPSSVSLPATSPNRQLYRNGSNLSGSSDSTSGGSLARRGNPAMESSQSVSTSSSGRSTRSIPSPTPPTSPAPVPAATPFVFPSSRSRGRPSNPTPGVSGFKFRGSRKSKAKAANVQVLAPGTPLPSEGVFTASPPPAPPQNLRDAPTPSVSSGSSGAAAAPAPTFYFPGSRTRAHPKSPTQFALGKTSKPRFLKLGLKSKKVVAAAAPAAPAPWVAPLESSPVQRAQAMLPPEEEEQYTEYGSYDEFDAANRDSTLVQPPSPQVATKIGAYPLDAYDAGLIESDRQTAELLRKVNATNTPSFHNYGGRPPRTVLDLGCGAGHWMLDAAMAWRNSGTQIIGFDMVDTTKGMWPVAQRQGIVDNIKFVRGNFVKQPLPFPDGSFQLVRMASLALCIPHERWEFVLDQVWRVLAVGGRLEFVDDQVFFPYGKPPQLSPAPNARPPSGVPTLDTMIPSTGFSRMSLADVVNPNAMADEDADSQVYDLYGVEEEDEGREGSDTDTLASGRRLETPTPHTRSSSRSSRSAASLHSMLGGDPEAWHAQAAAARELEALFEHMMNTKFGIHLRPSDFVGEMLMRVFGGVKEMTALHLTLAPPEHGEGQQRPVSMGGRPGSGRFERAQAAGVAGAGAGAEDTLGHCPGLILWPSTFIPMPPPELEAHVSKHLRALLSCKSALIDYAGEVADLGEGDAQSEAAMEALWEYQNFLRERFNPPPDDPSRAMSDASSSAGDANSIRGSIFSVSSVGTEALDAMREYSSELNARFSVPPERARPTRGSVQGAPTPTAKRGSVAESTSPAATSSTDSMQRPRKSRSRGSRGRDRASSVVTVAPPYSRVELTHVRSFYVYEAVKQAPDRFQVGGRMM